MSLIQLLIIKKFKSYTSCFRINDTHITIPQINKLNVSLTYWDGLAFVKCLVYREQLDMTSNPGLHLSNVK